VVGSHPTVIKVMDVEGVTMTYEVIYGNPVPEMLEIPGGMSISFSSGQAFKVEVKLVKSNGCMTIIPVVG
jgi:hypothetical protein